MNEVLAWNADQADQLVYRFPAPKKEKVKVIPELRKELSAVYRSVGHELSWPPPLEVQIALLRRLKVARCLHEFNHT